MKILVADDSLVTRVSLRVTLEELGHEVLEAEEGLQALEILQGPEAPHLAILDWLMPGMDGPDICQAIRAMNLGISPYLILLTAKDTKEEMILGLNMGADDFITKPYHVGELRARIQVGERFVALEMRLRERVLALEDAVQHIRTLQGILPICMFCHKIRDDQEVWQRLEDYLTDHTDAVLTHGLCPDCRGRMLE